MKYLFILLIAILEFGQFTIGTWDSGLSCPPVSLMNGKVQMRRRGKIIRFKCYEGFTLIGDKYSTCIRGNWDTTIPVCVNSRCPPLPTPDHALAASKYDGAVLIFFCEPGYLLVGNVEIYCNGKTWNGTAPHCRGGNLSAPTKCDFETPDLCWWEQDPKHDFDWRRHNFQTPSSHINTGPTYDHNFGPGNDGYYLYIEASGRLLNDSARIISPLYNASLTNSGCFSFWYHMYGVNIGALRIYFKLESDPDNPELMFEKHHNQGNKWLHGIFNLPKTSDNFQIVIEGIRGAGYESDLAVDDVAILQGAECLQGQTPNDNITRTSVADNNDQIEIVNAAQSCRGRCGNVKSTGTWTTIIPLTSPDACHCSDDCADNSTCCPDFAEYCVLAPSADDLYTASTGNDGLTVGHHYVSTPVEPKDELEPYTTKLTLPMTKSPIHSETSFTSFKTTHSDETTETQFAIQHVQQVQSHASLSSTAIISIIAALVAFGAVVTIVIMFIWSWRKSYVRSAKSSKGSGLSEDSDVRFLTSDEILDFNLARPSENDDP
ncbi:MAM and LDL-receptor class A domain-containing protein 2-like [Diachasmimorpha longicaudata]|uniref:MAM and LDL-receptor class A domain-containing protein 2-like n=1 Tax=Diachasmimorpha longicaudata TaxID=58733 RepID=UPI0030B8CF40